MYYILINPLSNCGTCITRAEEIKTKFINENKEVTSISLLEIELIGLCTDICVVSNALMVKANFYEKTVKVDSSCSAGVTVKSHNEALNTMRMCQIEII